MIDKNTDNPIVQAVLEEILEQETKESQQDTEEGFYINLPQKAREMAVKYINQFFLEDKKEMYYGGLISEEILNNSYYIDVILNNSIDSGVELCYKMLESAVEIDKDEDGLGQDIKLVISILEECNRKGVPKELAGGMCVLYLAICEGIEIVD